MAKVLKVSQSGYYKWVRKLAAPITEKELDDIALTEKIFELFKRSRGSFGSRKITKLINDEHDEPVNHKRIERLMRENDLYSRTHKKYVCTTDSDHEYPVANNLLDRDFHADQPNEKMVSDTTYIYTEEGWLYLAAIMDLYGRKIVGMSISEKNDQNLVIAALEDAKNRIGKKHLKGCILHSDRGSTYASNSYIEKINEYKMVGSMSRTGNCWDNAPIESFWGRMKVEWLDTCYKTKEEAIQSWIDEANREVSNA